MNLGINVSRSCPVKTSFKGAFKFVDSKLDVICRDSIEGDSFYKEVKSVFDKHFSWYRSRILYVLTDTKSDESIINKLNQMGVKHLYKNTEITKKMEKLGSSIDVYKVENLFTEA